MLKLTIADKKELKIFNYNEQAITEWQELGFYYTTENYWNNLSEWRFIGSKKGILNFARLLRKYTSDSSRSQISEHEHYGPYMLKVMTWSKAIITKDYFAGTLLDLETLADLIDSKVAQTEIGQIFRVDDDYGEGNTAKTIFILMADDFNPALMDYRLYQD